MNGKGWLASQRFKNLIAMQLKCICWAANQWVDQMGGLVNLQHSVRESIGFVLFAGSTGKVGKKINQVMVQRYMRLSTDLTIC